MCPGISDVWKSRSLFRVGVDLLTLSYLLRMLVLMSDEDVYVRWNTNCVTVPTTPNMIDTKN